MRCTYCGSRLHTISNCPKTWAGQGNRRAMRCTYCGKNDHNYEACPKIMAAHVRDPNGYVKDR